MNLDQLNAKVKGKADRHRVGRGPGSGNGCTAGRGNNGARCRSGWKRKVYFEGGQMSIIRRTPKRGFNNKNFGKVFAFVNLQDLNRAFEDGEVVTVEECLRRGVIPQQRSGLKVLSVGSLEKKLTIRAVRASKKAKEAIEAAGGTLELIAAPGDVSKKRWLDKRNQGKSTLRRVAATKRAANG